jgi:hypothetical protein
MVHHCMQDFYLTHLKTLVQCSSTNMSNSMQHSKHNHAPERSAKHHELYKYLPEPKGILQEKTVLSVQDYEKQHPKNIYL